MSTVEIIIPGCDGSEYVLFPACAYHGNRFDALRRAYPPMFMPQEARRDMPVTITDVPRLNKDGTGRIEVTTGDVSVPMVAIFSPAEESATFVLTVQQAGGQNIGLAYERGKVILTSPARRSRLYRWPFMIDGPDPYAPSADTIPNRVLTFPCTSLEAFYRLFFEHRKDMGLDDARPEVLPREEQLRIQLGKFNQMNWQEEAGFYDVDTLGQWQPGWVGGALSSYPLLKLGGPLEKERALRTLHYLFDTQAPSGLFYGFDDGRGDGFGTPGTEHWALVRKSGDCLYFLFKHFDLLDDIPERFIQGTRRLADAFARLWAQEGQFGQFVDCITGALAVGGSTCGAIIPAGLALAARFFGEERYLHIAKEAAHMLYMRDAQQGYTTGGPGEILQCPDSESAFALLESMVILYEETGEARWLDYARHMAHLCASWVVPYNYSFPDGSEFGRLGMKTIGSVFANVQNKHSAPGICTLSGDSLRKLHAFTGDPLYYALYLDITQTISQYMSTDARPIYAWDAPKDPTLDGNENTTVPRQRLPQGFICERVNLSDWETARCVGGVFCGSCWPEVSNLLALAECPPTPLDTVRESAL